MARCFLTGVEFDLVDGYVLNRRAAQDLHYALKGRVASLNRAIEQLAPLDEEESAQAGPHTTRVGHVRRKHRLVCKAVAEALAPGFPEIEMFLGWQEYRIQAQLRLQHKPCQSKGAAAAASSEHEVNPNY